MLDLYVENKKCQADTRSVTWWQHDRYVMMYSRWCWTGCCPVGNNVAMLYMLFPCWTCCCHIGRRDVAMLHMKLPCWTCCCHVGHDSDMLMLCWIWRWHAEDKGDQLELDLCVAESVRWSTGPSTRRPVTWCRKQKACWSNRHRLRRPSPDCSLYAALKGNSSKAVIV